MVAKVVLFSHICKYFGLQNFSFSMIVRKSFHAQLSSPVFLAEMR
jgi:hypothetical protein